MKTDTKISYLGNGLYNIKEASTYARLHHKTLSRWVEINGIVKSKEERFISFLDFVQALAIRNIRRQYNISLPKIKQAVQIAKNKYGITHPFAKEHTTFLYDKDIYISLTPDDDPTKLSGVNPGQMAMRPIIEIYMKDLCFNSDGLAVQYEPMKGIIMDPKFRFGEPVLQSVKLPAIVLWEAAKAEGSIEAAAAAYGVTDDEVVLASQYIDSLDLNAA